MPTIVTQKISPASTQLSPPINPPNKNQRMFPIALIRIASEPNGLPEAVPESPPHSIYLPLTSSNSRFWNAPSAMPVCSISNAFCAFFTARAVRSPNVPSAPSLR